MRSNEEVFVEGIRVGQPVARSIALPEPNKAQQTRNTFTHLISFWQHQLGLSSFLISYHYFPAPYVRAANTAAADRIYVNCAKRILLQEQHSRGGAGRSFQVRPASIATPLAILF